MYYLIYNEITQELSKAQVKCLNAECVNIEVTQDVYDNAERYIYLDGEIVLDPDYEAKQAQKEAERIAKLTCTKRVFALMLQEMGISYTTLKQLIATNEQAQLEWDLCVELERGNPLLDIMALQLGVTSERLDALFKYANGEITLEDFRAILTGNETSSDEAGEEVVEEEE